VDLLLSEVVLPGVSGRRLAEEAARSHSVLRRVFMSRYPAAAMVEQEMIPEGSAYLQKPFTRRDVVEVVERELVGGGSLDA
jgi:FixJ family two-component response regulator